MKNINWLIRFKSKKFWVSFIPAMLLLVQVILVPFGYDFQIEPINSQLLAIVNALFVVLALLGIVVDPTTEGIADSEQARKYTKLH